MTELDKAYDHSKVEHKIYKLWEESGFFNPDNLPGDRKEPYTIIMPPPNANAPLHVGHALGMTIEDILIRYHRMRGKKTLWLPGTDHAGFETQVVFEKKLEKEGRSRFKMQRQKFYKETWDFVQANKHITEDGLKRLGASCDWDRNIFTLDPKIVKIVYQTFKQMHDDGLIYRDYRICNWCVKHQTGLSDLETKYEEKNDPLYFIKYFLEENSDEYIEVATVRPETIFGDLAIAVNPNDIRYKHLVGKKVRHIFNVKYPATLPIIADEKIDMNFGSGAVKITPAHDEKDFEIWRRHKKINKELVQSLKKVINTYGRLNKLTGPYENLKVQDARKKIILDLTNSKQKIIDPKKTQTNYKHNVQVCYKCNTVIEPLPTWQWYVKMTEPLKDGRPSLCNMAIQALDKGEVNIATEKFEKIFRHWMENIRDWPISRQIVWGIPMPVWYCQKMQNQECETRGGIIIYTDRTDQEPSICPYCNSTELIRDLDTFDTWFSSGQWPYATLMANDAKRGTQDFKTYFPTQVIETGWDILFFWVARMVMFSYYKTNKPPFKKVYLHGLVRDKDRQKMSKSKGNVIDPLGIIDTYGTDALRFALIFSTTPGTDVPMNEEKIRGMKHFANKLWNIARFVLANSETLAAASLPLGERQTEADRDILKKLDETVKNVTGHLEAFRLHEAAQDIYQFTWHELADVYIEQSKEQLKDPKLKDSALTTLHYSLLTILKLLHPFMPFITEEIWSKLGQKDLLMVAEWPKTIH